MPVILVAGLGPYSKASVWSMENYWLCSFFEPHLSLFMLHLVSASNITGAISNNKAAAAAIWKNLNIIAHKVICSVVMVQIHCSLVSDLAQHGESFGLKKVYSCLFEWYGHDNWDSETDNIATNMAIYIVYMSLDHINYLHI